MVTVAKRGRQITAFGQRLRALRESAGLTQGELGERAGTTYQTIARYERGAVEPNWPTVLKLAEALGVSPNDFLDADSADADQPDTLDADFNPDEDTPGRPLGKRK